MLEKDKAAGVYLETLETYVMGLFLQKCLMAFYLLTNFV